MIGFDEQRKTYWVQLKVKDPVSGILLVLLSKDKQVQVAARAGAALAGLDDSELALLLVRADKSGFGEQLNEQVIGQLGEERIGRIARRLKAAAEGSRPLPVAADEQQVTVVDFPAATLGCNVDGVGNPASPG